MGYVMAHWVSGMLLLLLVALALQKTDAGFFYGERENLALGKVTKQRSDHLTSTLSPNAVDGSLSTYSSTSNLPGPWWGVDMGKITRVTDIVIWRTTTAYNQNGLIIYIGLNYPWDQTTPIDPAFVDVAGYDICKMWAADKAPYLGPAPNVIRCDKSIAGRYVIFKIPISTYLEFREVEIYGECTPLRNLALGKPTRQSEDFDEDWLSEKAVDGEASDSRCASTLGPLAVPLGLDWWGVDLMENIPIISIKFWRRAVSLDRQNGLKISVGLTSPWEDPSNLDLTGFSVFKEWPADEAPPLGPTPNFITLAEPILGRYVVFVIPASKHLSLCEVQVYGAESTITYGRYFSTIKDVVYTTDTLASYPARNRIRCTQLCLVEANCVSASYDRGQCTLHCSRTFDPNDETLISTPGAIYSYRRN